MAVIETIIDHEKDLTINIVTGAFDISEISVAAQKYLSGKPTSNVLWNFQNADGSGLTGQDLQSLQDGIRKAAQIAQRRKIAIAISRSLGYGLARVASTYAELAGLPVEYKIFYSLEEAMEWLDS